jgi:hypothetical protein
MDPQKEKQKQNPKNRYQISEKHWDKNKEGTEFKMIFREGGIQNLIQSDEKLL